MNSIRLSVEKLGFELPELGSPAANYVHRVRVGDQVYVSGQICMQAKNPGPLGKLGAPLSTSEGYRAARSAALGLLAQIAAEVEDRIDLVSMCRLGVFIASDADFTQHSEVANGASDLLTEVFGTHGRHARTAIGVHTLPAGVPIEIDAIFTVLSDVKKP